MQPQGENSEHPAPTGRQDGPPRQAQREMPRLSIRHSFSRERSSRRRKVFCLCILCWLMLLCLTGIIIIAVVHFHSSNSEIDQISAGALIGFGLLLIVVLGWSAFIYAKCQKGSSARQDSRRYAPREDILAFASSEIYTRGASTISTNNSDSSTEGNNRRFIYRERHREDERRVIDPVNTRYVNDSPISAIHMPTRIIREYQERGPGVARPHVLHFPERPRQNTEAPRVFVDPNRASRHVRRHSHPLPPPYQPPVNHSSSESLPMGFPPPAYDRVVGRMRRFDSTVSEESSLYPPDYQSTPPSPSSPLQAAPPTERHTSLNVERPTERRASLSAPTDRPPEHRTSLCVSSDRSTIDVGIQISTLPPLSRATRLDLSSCEAHQPSSFSASGMAPGENVVHHNPRRLSAVPHTAAQAPATVVPRYLPPHYKSTAPRFHHLHSPSPPQHSTAALSSHAQESLGRGHVSVPVYLANNRSPFSRSISALTAPENTIQESVDNEEESEADHESRTEIPRSVNQDDQQRPNVVLVYLAQSQEEEIIV